MKSSHKILLTLVAGVVMSLARTAAAAAETDWIAYRVANNLAVDPLPTPRGAMTTDVGPVPDATPSPIAAPSNGNGSAHASSGYCDDPLVVEMSRSDGNTAGYIASCAK